MLTILITPRCHSFYSGIRIYGWWCESRNANQPNTIHLVMFISWWWTLRKLKSTKFVSVLAKKRHKTSNSRKNLDENGCLILTYNQLHGAAGQVRTVGHKWRCESCLRKWRLQLIYASKWEIVTNVSHYVTRHSTLVSRRNMPTCGLCRRGGVALTGVSASPFLVMSTTLYVIWRVWQPYGRETFLFFNKMTRIAAPAEKPDRTIGIPTPMNIIALLVALPASPSYLAVPLRDCDVWHIYPTQTIFQFIYIVILSNTHF